MPPRWPTACPTAASSSSSAPAPASRPRSCSASCRGSRAYVPIDVSQSALSGAKRRLAAPLSRPRRAARSSAISRIRSPCRPISPAGPRPASSPARPSATSRPPRPQRLLRVFRALLSPGGRLIVGVDLKKDARKLVLAYNDAAGVTAAFNLNLLARINRELGGYVRSRRLPARGDLQSARRPHRDASGQPARPGRERSRGRRFRFRTGETIHTENSYKYSVRQFQDVARAAGWPPARVWTDADDLFSVHELMTR